MRRTAVGQNFATGRRGERQDRYSLRPFPQNASAFIGLAGLALVLVLGSALGLAGAASAQTLSIEEAENFVRAAYFEGMPEEVATRIGPTGAARLVEMLADPDERSSHGQIMLALGLCGSPEALAAIEIWMAEPRRGEIDRNTFRAWQALPFALGHLAAFDPRALQRLETMMNEDAPDWTFRQHRGARLRRLARDSAVTSLAETGLPEARRMLERAGGDASDIQFERHLREVRALHAERAREVAR